MPEDQDDRSRGLNFTEKTKAQVTLTFGRDLTSPLPATYDTYRTMRKHPTLALARALITAPVMAGSWSTEADDDVEDAEDKIKFIKGELEPVREEIIENSMYGGIDFGWAPHEIVFGQSDGGLIGLDKVKRLLQDLTTILVDEQTGEFAGYKQTGINAKEIELDSKYILHVAFRIEGTNWYGASLMENARETYNKWREADKGAERYDAKIAGSHWVVYYPVGSTPDEDGIETDNADIADDMLTALESSGSLAIPQTVSAYVKELSNSDPAWRVEILEDKGGRQPTFIDRLKYLDALLVRSLFMPERAILEGEFGTKAEAGVHADLAVTMVTLWDRMITEAVNRQIVDTLVVQNWGEQDKGKIFLVPSPLVDTQIAFLRDLYKTLATNPTSLLEEFPTINTDALKDRLGVPKTEEVAQAGEVPAPGIDPAQRERMEGVTPTFGGQE